MKIKSKKVRSLRIKIRANPVKKTRIIELTKKKMKKKGIPRTNVKRRVTRLTKMEMVVVEIAFANGYCTRKLCSVESKIQIATSPST